MIFPSQIRGRKAGACHSPRLPIGSSDQKAKDRLTRGPRTETSVQFPPSRIKWGIAHQTRPSINIEDHLTAAEFSSLKKARAVDKARGIAT